MQIVGVTPPPPQPIVAVNNCQGGFVVTHGPLPANPCPQQSHGPAAAWLVLAVLLAVMFLWRRH